FGLALIIQGVFQNFFGSSGLPYSIPDELKGGTNLGFMFLPIYRGWVVVFSLVVCLATWYLIEKTRLGANLRAATENPTLVRAFGINVPRMITLTYGLGVGLAALAGVLSAPINQVRPLMGADLIIVVFAVVVIGGMGSIMGSIVTGFALGVIEGLTKYFYPEASNTVVFVFMVLVLLVKPTGLTGRAAGHDCDDRRHPADHPARHAGRDDCLRHHDGAACAGAVDGHLSVLCDAGVVLCAARLRVQPPDRLWRPALVRACDVPGDRRLLQRARAEGLGPAAGARDPGRDGRRLRARGRDRPRCDPAPGHLFRHDHIGVVAASVLCLCASAVHPWRGRHPGSSTGPPVRNFQSLQPDDPLLLRARELSLRLSGDLSRHQFAVRRGAESGP